MVQPVLMPRTVYIFYAHVRASRVSVYLLFGIIATRIKLTFKEHPVIVFKCLCNYRYIATLHQPDIVGLIHNPCSSILRQKSSSVNRFHAPPGSTYPANNVRHCLDIFGLYMDKKSWKSNVGFISTLSRIFNKKFGILYSKFISICHLKFLTFLFGSVFLFFSSFLMRYLNRQQIEFN